jgi:hypothetical protein
MNTREPKTKSKEKKKSALESKCSSRSPEEDKPRTSASFSKKACKSTNPIILTKIHMKVAIMELI